MSTGRGSYTQKVANLLKSKFGRRSQPFLRLLPFLQHTLMNKQYIDERKLNEEEKEIVDFLYSEGYLGKQDGYLTCSKEFYDSMNEILWVSYVDCQNQSMT